MLNTVHSNTKRKKSPKKYKKKKHFRILDPEIRKFNGNVSHGCGNGGGGLGGQRGDDCRIDLGLKGCGGFRHPKKKRKCGLELGQAAAAAET